MYFLWLPVVFFGYPLVVYGQPQVKDLLQVYRLAVESSPNYLAAGAGRLAVLEGLAIAQGAYQPQVNLSLNGSLNNQVVLRQSEGQSGNDTTYEGVGLNLGVRKPLYRPALKIAIDQADILIQQADVTYAVAHQDLILHVSESYFNVLREIDELNFAKAELEAYKQQLNQSEQRFAVGLIGITDVEEAKAGFDRSQAQLIEYKTNLDTAHEMLREITGVSFSKLALLNEETPFTTPPSVTMTTIENWVEISLMQNLDIQALRYQVVYQERDIDRIEANNQLTVDVIGNYQLNHSNGPIGDGSDNQITSIALTFDLPLYTGGINGAKRQRHTFLHQQALERLEAKKREVLRITRNAYRRINAWRLQVNALQQAVRSATTAANAVEAGFQVGTRTSVEVLQARQALFRSLSNLSAARYNFLLDQLRLKKIAGILSVADLSNINNWLH